MTDVHGQVTAVAPDPNTLPGQAPESPSRGTNGERSASLSSEERRAAGLLNDGDTIIPQVPHNDGHFGGRQTEVVTADGSQAEAPRETFNAQNEAAQADEAQRAEQLGQNTPQATP